VLPPHPAADTFVLGARCSFIGLGRSLCILVFHLLRQPSIHVNEAGCDHIDAVQKIIVHVPW